MFYAARDGVKPRQGGLAVWLIPPRFDLCSLRGNTTPKDIRSDRRTFRGLRVPARHDVNSVRHVPSLWSWKPDYVQRGWLL